MTEDKGQNTLTRVAQGGAVFLIGTIAGAALAFASRVVLVRTVSMEEYGLFALAFAIIQILITIAFLGLKDGLVRFIAYSRAKDRPERTKGTITSSALLLAISSVIALAAGYALRGPISQAVLGSSDLVPVLTVMLLAIPLWMVTQFMVYAFRGMGRVKEKVLFDDVLLYVTRIAAFGIAIALGAGLLGMIWALVASFALTAAIGLAYFLRRVWPRMKGVKAVPMKRRLLAFSLPLLASGILGLVIAWTDTIMLGYYLSAEHVGLYNAATPVVKHLPIFLHAFAFLLGPSLAGMFAHKRTQEMKSSYAAAAKWSLILTAPAAAGLLLFPDLLLRLFFGAPYAAAGLVLQILTIGLLVRIVLGPSVNALSAIDRTKLIMASSVLGVALNIGLNLALIPKYGMTGAALASAVSIIGMYLMNAWWLYRTSKIHAFTFNYAKAVIWSLALGAGLYAATLFLPQGYPTLFISVILYGAIFVLGLPLLKVLDASDLAILEAIESRAGRRLKWLRRIFFDKIEASG